MCANQAVTSCNFSFLWDNTWQDNNITTIKHNNIIKNSDSEFSGSYEGSYERFSII